MNLRFTKAKVILTLILTAALYVASSYFISSAGAFKNFLKMFKLSTATNDLVILGVTIVVIYIILSVFHRRRLPALQQNTMMRQR